MAGSTSAHVRNFRDATHSHNKEAQHFTKSNFDSELTADRKGKKFSSFELTQQALRYNRYSKYWSILSNVAAIVSVSSAIFSVMKKRRWL